MAILAIVKFGYHQGWIPQIPSYLYETTLFVIFTTALISIYLYRSDNASFFVQLYFLSIVLKLLAYFAYNLIMILDDRRGAAINVMYFLLAYFIFTAVEIGFLYTKISGKYKP